MLGRLSKEEAQKFLEKSDYSKMGPFKFKKTDKVSLGGHKKYGAPAHCFIGKYHRHVFFVFMNEEIIFVNEEDEDLLFDI